MVVSDSATSCGSAPLNEQLSTQIDMLNSHCAGILRFGQYCCLLVANIEAMFHQMKVSESDWDSLVFL